MNAPPDDSSAPKRLAETFDTFDRRLGKRLRLSIDGMRLAPVASAAAVTIGPAFRGLVAAWLLRGTHRRLGIESAVAATTAAQIARLLRDRIGRTRPGPRTDGGFPSRHAAAAIAIASSARRHDHHGRTLGAVAAIGLLGRVANGSHEPLDIVAGGTLGHFVERAVAAAARRAVNVRR